MSTRAIQALLGLTLIAPLVIGAPGPSWAEAKKAKPAAKPAAKKSTGTKKSTAAKKAPGEAAAAALVKFCEEWMQKLQTRERENLQHIKWETGSDGVRATYTGYSQEHTCKVVEGTEKDPVAKIVYRELIYQKRGKTIAEAEQSPPQTIEIFDVQEIFHYLRGKWDI